MSRNGVAKETFALGALAGLVVVTVLWWAGALWPLPATTPEWVQRARTACFGRTESGLPDSGGWILLIGAPVSTFVALAVIAREELGSGLSRMASSRWGRRGLLGAGLLLLALSGAAGARVSAAYGWAPGGAAEPSLPDASSFRRLQRPAPPLSLLDQHGATVALDEFRGRPVILTFAFGKCETVCPVIVRSGVRAVEELSELAPVLLVVTLDPWRDTSARLPHIAASWGLTGEARVLGGSVEEVNATLDGWGVERTRDPRTGDILHASLAYVLDSEGRIAFTVTGSTEQMVTAARRAVGHPTSVH